MIRNVIFDIGNVLVDFRWKEYLIDKGFSADMIKRIVKASVASPYWDEFDKGALSEEETMRLFISCDSEIEKELHEAYDSIVGMITRREDAIPWVKALKEAGYGVYYLSNFSKKAYDECYDTIDFLPYMDGGVLSYQEKVIKPDPAIYNILLERYGLTPSECVFIDDTEKNITSARELGFAGIVHTSYDDTSKQLADLGVVYHID